MEGSRGWEGENQFVKETRVSLSMPVRAMILVTYRCSSASAPSAPVADLMVVPVLPLGMSPVKLMQYRVASTWGGRDTC